MIIEGGRIKYAWGLQLLAIVFGWLTSSIREILLPKGELGSVRFTILFTLVLVVCFPVLSQDCDVDFPGTSTLNFSATCGGSSIDNLTLGKNISLGDNDTFTFDAPAAINILGSLDVDAQGDGRIIIPAGVTVIIDGNMRLDPQTGGCESGNPCTFTIEVNGILQILGDFRSNLVTLVWEGSGTVEVKDKFENSSNACMTCSVNCPSFPIGAGGCDDKGSGCTENFCVSHYGSTNCGSDNIDPTITNCPVDISVSMLPGSCDAVVNWTPPTASDNCNLASFTGNHNPGDIFPLGLTKITYSAIDDNGNSTVCSFQVDVVDNTGPVVANCPADLLVFNFDPGADVSTVNWTEPVASDNCAISSFTSTHQPGDQFSKGVTMVTYSAFDDAGNKNSCSFTVEVLGNSPPVADDIFIQTNGINPVKVCYDASDKDGDGIILTNVNYNTGAGLVDQVDPNQLCFLFTPSQGSFGIQIITATICDDRNPSGCSEVKAKIEVLKEEITIYKAFSPNGDAINDVWHIGNIEQYPENTVTIFDRWGSVIYNVTGYNNENVVWDGRGNGRGVSSTSVVPSGTYFFSIELQGSGSKSGFLELIN